MKHFNLVKIIICLFIFSQLYAQCDEQVLEYNSSFIMANGSNSDNYHYIKMSQSALLRNQKIYINNYSISDSASILIFTSESCDTLPSSIYSAYVNPLQNIIDLTTISSNSELYIMILSPDDNPGIFKIEYSGAFVETSCDNQANVINSINNPTQLLISSLEGSVSISACNNYTSNILFSELPTSNYLNNNYKWFDLESSISGMININITPGSIIKPSVIVVGIKDNVKSVIYQEDFILEPTLIKFISIDGFDHVKIAIASESTNAGDFDLTVSKLRDKSSCVDYIGNGDELKVLSTSMNSPLSGPFKPGEIVRFRYSLYRWVPIRNNWPHSAILNYSEQWELDSFPRFSDSTHWKTVTDPDNFKEDLLSWTWFDSDPSVNSDIISNNSFAGKGWYFTNFKEGPLAEQPIGTWGSRYKHSGNTDTSLLQVDFSLKLRDTINCTTAQNIYVRVYPHSDYETGNFPIQGCSDNGYEEIASTVNCCITNPNSFTLAKDKLCYGDPIFIRSNTKGKFTWSIPKNLQNGKGQYNLTLPTKNINGVEKSDSIILFIKESDKDYCPDSTRFAIKIYPLPEVDLGKDRILCTNTLCSILDTKSNPNNKYTWFVNSHEVSAPLINTLETTVSSDQNIKLIAINENNCKNNDEVQLKVDAISFDNCPDSIFYCKTYRTLETGSLFASSRFSKNTNIRYYNHQSRKELKKSELTFGQYNLEARNSHGCTLSKTISIVEAIIYDTIYINIPMYDNNENAFYVLDFMNISSRSKISNIEDPCTKHEKIFILKKNRQANSNELICQPNPSRGEFKVRIPQNIDATNSDLYIVDQSGKLKFSIPVNESIIQVNAKLDNGTYFLVLVKDNINLASKTININ